MADDLNSRISFIDDLEIAEFDFSNFTFTDSKAVNEFYDLIEQRITETGEDKWYFLINYHMTRIFPEAWFSYARRGKALNLRFSQGSVRFDPSEDTRREIARHANTEAFNPNLVLDRDAALKRITEIPSLRRKKITHTPTYTAEQLSKLISFDAASQIMEVRLKDIYFKHSLDVDMFYDICEAKIAETGEKWYFLVDYNNCRIFSEAWVSYGQRGKDMNIASSLGSVRYAAGSETEKDIRMRAESQGFRPNIRNTREEAVERIEEMKAEAA